jgi:hypothetical protein
MKTINIFFFEFIEMFSKMEFRLNTQKQVDVGTPPMNIALEEGTYNTLCKIEGSNPAADIKIFLDDVEQPGAITTLEDKDRIGPSFFLHQCFFVHHGNTFKYCICMH